jgi:hypothetical protein
MDNANVLPCDDKLKFDTRSEAEATATVARHRYGSQLKTYKCKHCGLWHLSSG